MSHWRRTLLVVCVVVLVPGVLLAGEQKKSLFDGKSLNGWGFHLEDPSVKMEDVWSVKDGVIVCTGKPLGYLHTKDNYKNFKLTLQWRWAPGKKPGNSGVLLRADDNPIGFMPKCVEAQLMHGSAGDIWAFRGAKLEGPKERFREVKGNPKLGDFPGVRVMENMEKDPGQWNTYEIVMQGDKLTLSINGKKVNEATGCDEVAGKIGLQSEGAEIHFRNIYLVPLD